MRILGFSDDDITAFRQKGGINPEITIFAPIGAPWSSARSAPVNTSTSGASDPVYVIGDLSTVWLTAFVRESDAAKVAVGQDVTFNVMALPGRR